MKTKLIFYALLVLFAACSSLKTAPDVIREITRKVESKDYTIAVNYANPLRMRPVYLTSEYEVRIKNDSAFAYLPYFGVTPDEDSKIDKSTFISMLT
jgi:predicted component of type VI protein secretion system